MTEKMLKKRQYLKETSQTAEKMAEGTDFEDSTVNAKLMRFIYNPKNNLEFRSFKNWRKQGFTVRKGSKAFLLWGQPINKNAEKYEDLHNLEDAETEDIFFPIAFVFSSDQVRKTKKKKTQTA